MENQASRHAIGASRRELFAALGGLTVAATAPIGFGPAMAQPAPVKPAASLPVLDFDRIGERLVGSFQPQKGERAILLYDPDYYPEIAQSMTQAFRDRGVDQILWLTFGFDSVEPSEFAVASATRQDRAVEMLTPLFRSAEMFAWLPTKRLSPDNRWEHALGASPKTRGLHCHFIFPPLGPRSQEQIDTMCRRYEAAIIKSDYTQMTGHMDRMIGAIRGRTLSITSPDGTDFTIAVRRDGWFHKSDGDMSPSRALTATAVRDREIEHPGGALRMLPDPSTTTGRLVANIGQPSVGSDRVVMDFRDGKLVKWRAERDPKAFADMLEEAGGDIDKVAEIVIGTNPLLAPPFPWGELPYYGFGAGAVRVSLGDNWESGGNLRANGHILWTFVNKATVRAGRDVLIRDGVLV